MRMQGLYRTAGWSTLIAVFLMFYVYQHFRCIDLSFQLEDLKVEQARASSFNSELKLEIASLRNPMRIDIIAHRQLRLTQPLPTQVQEFDQPSGAEVANARFVHPNRAP
jgi:cell division protein FtsL